MRIIAGSLRGRKLQPPVGSDIRPTADRTRESIFNLIMHGQWAGASIRDQHVVDLCCGTGALGLEAISRGAARASFVDHDKRSLALAKENAAHCGVIQACDFLLADVTRLPAAPTPAATVFIDAPYASALLAPAYEALAAGGWLMPGTLIVAELPRDTMAPGLANAALVTSRHYGKAAIHLYRID